MIALKNLEDFIKKHILVSMALTLLFGIVGSIIFQNYVWSKEPTPIVFSYKEVMNLTAPDLYDVTSSFSVFNPTKEKIIVDLPFIRIPNEIF